MSPILTRSDRKDRSRGLAEVTGVKERERGREGERKREEERGERGEGEGEREGGEREGEGERGRGGERGREREGEGERGERESVCTYVCVNNIALAPSTICVSGKGMEVLHNVSTMEPNKQPLDTTTIALWLRKH